MEEKMYKILQNEISRNLKNIDIIKNVNVSSDDQMINIYCIIYNNIKIAFAIKKSLKLFIMKSVVKIAGLSNNEMETVATDALDDCIHTKFVISANQITFSGVFPLKALLEEIENGDITQDTLIEKVIKIVFEFIGITTRACKKLRLGNEIVLTYETNYCKDESNEEVMNETTDINDIKDENETDTNENKYEEEISEETKEEKKENSNRINIDEVEESQNLTDSNTQDDVPTFISLEETDMIGGTPNKNIENDIQPMVNEDDSSNDELNDELNNEPNDKSDVTINDEDNGANDKAEEMMEKEEEQSKQENVDSKISEEIDTRNVDNTSDLEEKKEKEEKEVEEVEKVEKTKKVEKVEKKNEDVMRQTNDLEDTSVKNETISEEIKEEEIKEEEVRKSENVEEEKTMKEKKDNVNVVVSDNRKNEQRDKQKDKFDNKNRKNKEREEKRMENIQNSIFLDYAKELDELNKRYYHKIKSLDFDGLLNFIESRYKQLTDNNGNQVNVPKNIKDTLYNIAREELKNRCSR